MANLCPNCPTGILKPYSILPGLTEGELQKVYEREGKGRYRCDSCGKQYMKTLRKITVGKF